MASSESKMSFKKSSILLLVAACLVAFVSSYPQPYPEEYLMAEPEDLLVAEPLLVRRARSPEGGSVVLTASKDPQFGREASVQYNHNLYTSRDGRGTIDAYAQASRNFDFNRNNYGGGLQASWRF
ncbi:uncharacterized protein LOC110185194 [Drosophila serrata]|uniref:uncharacterized protein LOC110185194 n=1 Tax=Drosophila serrata TaxID=7274 RepID=UPI000A1D15ED|nr:uncharacterized protein LOC110185194 [Drosophila serrata]